MEEEDGSFDHLVGRPETAEAKASPAAPHAQSSDWQDIGLPGRPRGEIARQRTRLSHTRGISHVAISARHRRSDGKSRSAAGTWRVGAPNQSEGRRHMTAVWIMLLVCVSSSPSCAQGDVSVANTSYASSEQCYAEGMKRARGRIVVCIEGKQGQ
jgi:hypothetical protein